VHCAVLKTKKNRKHDNGNDKTHNLVIILKVHRFSVNVLQLLAEDLGACMMLLSIPLSSDATRSQKSYSLSEPSGVKSTTLSL